jgi:osmotically-inducible protein OsmY
MSHQYRRDSEHQSRPRGGRDAERGDYGREAGERGRGRGWRDDRGGQSGRGEREREDVGYGMHQLGGIRRETGWDRGGWGRDERDSREWQQRVGDDQQGYRSPDRESDREWRGEPGWQSDRPRGWQRGRDWHGRSPEYGGERRPEPRREAAEDRGWPRPERWSAEPRGGGGWSGGSGYGGYGAASSGREPWSGGRSWSGGYDWRDEGGREPARDTSRRGPGGGWPWGGEGGPLSTWGVGGSESGRGIGGTREGASPNYAGRGPKGYKRSDERIREEVSDRLMDDPRVDASEIEVQVKDGEVTLTGTVPDRDQKRCAEDCAEGINGVADVTNHLRVSRSDSWSGESAQKEAGASQAGSAPQASQRGTSTAATQAGTGVDSPGAGKPGRSTTPTRS